MKNNKFDILKIIFYLTLVCFGSFAYTIFNNNIFPVNYRIISFSIIILFLILLGWVVFRKKNNRILNVSVIVLMSIMSIVFVISIIYINKGVSTIKNLNEKHGKEYLEYSIIVPKNSEINSVKDLSDKEITTALSRDEDNINHLVSNTEELKKFKLVDGSDYISMAKNLLENNIKVVLFDETYRSIVEDKLPNFSKDTKIIGKYSIEKNNESTEETEEESTEETKEESTEETKKELRDNDSFNIYISGIDTYGGISSKGRSDVNLIVSVNPKRKKITITTIPRDSYLPIAGGGRFKKDKLTHSGIYGMDSSVKTLENFLDIDIDYYVRVNFSSLIKVVNALGGIDVNSPQSFTTIMGNYRIKKGINHLNGEEALGFARERKSLNNGDFDRGRNHMRIVEAIINKAMKPSILLKYHSILDAILESSQTNFPYDKIIELVNYQLSNGGNWDITKQDITGSGTLSLPSYAMPGWKLYMLVPDKNSVRKVIKGIKSNNQ